MRLAISRIGNFLGVIIPKTMLDRWMVRDGSVLDATSAGIFPPRQRNAQARLDEFKHAIALAVIRSTPIKEIRRRSLENLQRWRANGVWCGAYDEWLHLLQHGTDGDIYAIMAGHDQVANRLRQSPPYTGMLPDAVVEKLREETTLRSPPA